MLTATSPRKTRRWQKQRSRKYRAQRRQLRKTRRLGSLEMLEARQMLAGDLIFADSFEGNHHSNDWLGSWVEDSQNDWFRSTQRATDGQRSAEVDGLATDATLTLANPLDLTSYVDAEVNFSWYIESGFDGGEYVAVDLYNGTWNEVAKLQGNVDQENTWHHETITVDSSYLVDDFQIRFRAKVSRWHEDANVDNVQIFATPGNLPEISISDAQVVEGDDPAPVKIAHQLNGGPTLAEGNRLGRSVASLGDLDGDGVGDLAVGAFEDDFGGMGSGAVHILFLNADGTVKNSTKIDSSMAGIATHDNFGISVASLGDLDGDNNPELAVGARGDDTGFLNAGAVYVLYLNSDGTIKSSQTKKIAHETNGGPTLAENSGFGGSMNSLGDLDGDGITDLVASGASRETGGGVYILFMNADGSVKDTATIDSSTPNGPTLAPGDGYGFLASIGDLDGDMVGDIAVGAWKDATGGPDRGAVYIHFLNTDGTLKGTTKIAHQMNGGPSLSDGDIFGSGMAGIGDLDGDNVNDLLVAGDDGWGSGNGLYTLFLNSNGTVKSFQQIGRDAGGAPALDDGDGFGVSAVTIGDRDGDGITDLAIGAFNDDTGFDRAGAVYLAGLNADGSLKGTTIDFTVTRTGDTSGSSMVTYTTDDGTAIAGSDYVATTDTIEFLPGETSKTVSVQIIGDTSFEDVPDETFLVTLSNPIDATVVGGPATGSIEDDDPFIPNTDPVADAGGPYSVDEGSSVTLDGSASQDTDGTIVSYEWDLDDDGQYDDATGVTTSFSSNQDGVHTVGLRVTDDLGAVDTTTASVTVNNVAPTAEAGGPYAGNEGSNIVLDGSASSDPANDIVSYQWNLDNNGSYETSGASVVFNQTDDGVYTVGLRVTDDAGAIGTDTAQVTLSNVAPTAEAGGPYVTDEGVDVILTAAGSSDPGGDIVSYQWDLDDDGSFDDATGITTTFNSATAGSFPVAVRVTDDDGAFTDDSTTVTVTAAPTGPSLAHGVEPVTGADPGGWTTVQLGNTYESMVVIASANYDSGSAPGVVRIQNASGNSFQVRVDVPGGGSLVGIPVHYIVVEEGVYDEAGFKLEAVKFDSTVTDENNSWGGESRSYQQSYSSPVVVGQVMSYNDADWSVFWAAGSSRTSPPSPTALTIGKHVGEDSDVTRATETIGYLVIEATSNGTIETLPFVAGVGSDIIRGMDNAPPYQYGYAAMPNAKTAVVSQAGMDGGDGGWAVLYGSNPLPPAGGTLDVAIDEDQIANSERKHTTEQVAYFIIDPPAGQVGSESTSTAAVVKEPAVEDSKTAELFVGLTSATLPSIARSAADDVDSLLPGRVSAHSGGDTTDVTQSNAISLESLLRGVAERAADADELGQLFDDLGEADWSLRAELVAGLAAAR